MTMRAARYHGRLDIRIDEIPIPVPKEHEVLIQIEWCGICGTDLHEYEFGPIIVPREGRPHPLTKETLPVTLGHEFCGRIIKTSQHSDLKIGQAVMVDPRLYCRSCSRCKGSNTHGCYSWGFCGISGGGGGLAEAVTVDARMCYPLPDDVDLSNAALIEPLAVGLRAVKNAGIQDFAGKTVLILGGGPIGLAVSVVLKTKGAKSVYFSEPTATRRKQDAEVAEGVFDPLTEKVAEKCREVTGGEGVDVVFDCAGVETAMKDGMDALKFGGVYVNVASWTTPFIIPPGYWMVKELSIKASLSYTDQDFRETVEAFCGGAFRGIEKFVTSRISLDDVVEKGFVALIRNKDDHIKILVSPKGGNEKTKD